MVKGYHAIFAGYGFWLPNEQRGSWSTEVWAPHLRQFGPATKTERAPFARSSSVRPSRPTPGATGTEVSCRELHGRAGESDRAWHRGHYREIEHSPPRVRDHAKPCASGFDTARDVD